MDSARGPACDSSDRRTVYGGMASRRKKKESEDTGGILTAEERILKEVHDAYVVRETVAEDPGLLGELAALGHKAQPADLALKAIMDDLKLRCLVPRKRINVMK